MLKPEEEKGAHGHPLSMLQRLNDLVSHMSCPKVDDYNSVCNGRNKVFDSNYLEKNKKIKIHSHEQLVTLDKDSNSLPPKMIGCENFSCDVCFQVFSDYFVFRSHQNIHKNEQPPACGIISDSNLRQKVADYRKELSAEGSQDFSDYTDLERHQKVHTVEPLVSNLSRNLSQGVFSYTASATKVMHKVFTPHIISGRSSTPKTLSLDMPFTCTENSDSNSCQEVDENETLISDGCVQAFSDNLDSEKDKKIPSDEPELVLGLPLQPFSCTKSSDFNSCSKVDDSKTFTCDRCSQVFSNDLDFEKHQKIHSDKPEFILGMPLQPVTHTKSSDYNLHLKVDDSQKLICDVCSEVFSDNLDFEKHQKIHSDEPELVLGMPLQPVTHAKSSDYNLRSKVNDSRKLICDVCAEVFSDSLDFENHQTIHSDEPPLVSEKSDLTSHKSYKAVGNEKEICDTCQRTFSNKYKLKIHKACHSDERLFTCNLCNRSFHLKDSMLKHKKTHFGDSELVCLNCNQTFPEKSDLTNHACPESVIKKYACDICHVFFKEEDSLKLHSRVHASDKPWWCEICLKNYSDLRSFKLHIQRILEKKDSKKDFSENSDFERHQMMYTGKLTSASGKSSDSSDSSHKGLEKKKYFCDICNNAYASKNYLLRHKAVHTEERQFICDVCNRSFHLKDTMLKHKKTHFDDSELVCLNCNQTFLDKMYLKDHACTGNILKRYKCDICHKYFKYEEYLQIHTRVHKTDKPWLCDICQKDYGDFYKFRVHMRYHRTKPRDFPCNLCSSSFFHKRVLEKHVETVHSLRSFSCDLCLKEFKNEFYLKRHCLLHSKDKQVECDVCHKRFIDTSSRNRHFKTVHSGLQPTIPCSICGKKFKNNYWLGKHILFHTDKKPFTCPVCHKGHRTKPELQYHVRIHTGEKPHACHVCDCKFRGPSSLRKHLLSHDLTCKMCQETFPDRKALSKHLLIHPEKTITCDVCQKAFTYEAALQRHKSRIHTGVTFDCDVCQKMFANKASLARHKYRHLTKTI